MTDLDIFSEVWTPEKTYFCCNKCGKFFDSTMPEEEREKAMFSHYIQHACEELGRNILAAYVFGSEDSTDLDILYIVRELPDLQEFKKLDSQKEPLTKVEKVLVRESGKKPNRNFATLDEDGIRLAEVVVGIPDETNNAVVYTYSLHDQAYPLILVPVERDIWLKAIRAVRVILTYNTRTAMRKEVKAALKSGSLSRRLDVLRKLPLEPPFNKKKLSDRDILKSIAFQLGQTLALMDGKELYTKKEIARTFPELEPFLYRRGGDTEVLRRMATELADAFDFTENGHVVEICEIRYDVIKEVRVND